MAVPGALRPNTQVVIRGGRLGFSQRRQIDRGDQVVLHSLAGETLDPLRSVADRIRNLWVVAVGAIDLTPIVDMAALETLTLHLERPGPVIDLSALPRLREVGLTSSNSWRRAGSAISAHTVERVAIWSPEASLFREHRTLARQVRLSLARKLDGLPPLSDPSRVTELAIDEVASLDLAGIETWSSLERLQLAHVKSLTGFGRLQYVPRLRSLALEVVREVDEPSALLDLPLEEFHEAAGRSQAERIWWLPDLERLQERGVEAMSPEWRTLRAAYEERWSRRTGRPIPRHFPPP